MPAAARHIGLAEYTIILKSLVDRFVVVQKSESLGIEQTAEAWGSEFLDWLENG